MTCLPSVEELEREDMEARRRALDPETSFLVQAPAGSGKTTLLVARYLALLAVVDYPEEIVALTFTRKAAAEMRQRILESLSGEPAPARDPVLQDLVDGARVHARRRGWDETELPLRLRVQTIDQLTLGIVHRWPWRGAAGTVPRPTEQAQGMYRRAARRLLDDLDGRDETARAVRALLLHLDDPIRFLTLIESMLARREQWLPLLGKVPDRSDLEAAWREHLEARTRKVAGLPRRLRVLADWIERFVPGVSRDACLEDRLSWIRLLRRTTLTQKGDWFKASSFHHVRKQLSLTDDATNEREVQEHWTRLMAALGNPTPGGPLSSAWLADAGRFPDPVIPGAEWDLLLNLLLVLVRALVHLQAVFREERRVDFSEVTRLAQQALGEDEAPTDLQLGLDYRIRHLLVDEFQDTSVSHYRFLARLVRGWTPGDGRSFFAVGDPMQSIYRFRQADVTVFLDVRRRGRLGDLPLTSLVLHRNFRSTPELVTWINHFADVFSREDDLDRGTVGFVTAVPARPAEPETGVRVHRVDAKEAPRHLAALIGGREARGRRAILFRARSQAPPFVETLRARNIPLRLIDVVALAALPAVEDLLALAEALLHPADARAWFSVLRAPWCGVRNATLAAIAADSPGSPGLSLLSGRLPQELAPDDARLLAEIVPVLNRGVEQVARHGLRRGVEAAWVTLGGPAALDKEIDLLAAERFLDFLEEPDLIETWRLDPTEFERRVREMRAPDDARGGDPIEILTLHGAKGLEWDEVFLPTLERRTRTDPPDLLVWQELFGREGQRFPLLAARPRRRTGEDEGEPPDRYDYLCRLQRERDRAEDARLAYVAATRAARELHLFLPPSSGGGAGELAKVFLKIVDEYGPTPASEGTADPTPSPPPTSRPIRKRIRLVRPLVHEDPPSHVSLPSEDEGWRPELPVTDLSAGNERSRLVGTVLHDLLARLADRAPLPRDPGDVTVRARRLLASAGLTGRDLDRAAGEVETALVRVLTDRRGRWILAPRAEARTEWAIDWRAPDGEVRRFRLDRSFRDGRGRRWIVDYKLGRHEGGPVEAFVESEWLRHRAQLEVYARALRALGESAPIHLGLYFPLLRAWRSWPAATEAFPTPETS